MAHYEKCFAKYGDSHLGVDWPNAEDAQTRYKVMLKVIKEYSCTLLDFGCGLSHLYEYILKEGHQVFYSGLDISPKFVVASKAKFPDIPYYCFDILNTSEVVPDHDYVVMNGVLTEKRGLSFKVMWEYARALLEEVFDKAEVGMAFNVMSSHVDWERDDLFHLPLDMLVDFLRKKLTRNFVIRGDYGLYEYTTYVYR